MANTPRWETRIIFTWFEKELLLQLVDKNKDVIENKETNKVASSQKLQTWKKIEGEFNATTGVVKRNAKQLMQCYRNLKKRAKSQARYRFETQGGQIGIFPEKSRTEVAEQQAGNQMVIFPDISFLEGTAESEPCAPAVEKETTKFEIRVPIKREVISDAEISDGKEDESATDESTAVDGFVPEDDISQSKATNAGQSSSPTAMQTLLASTSRRRGCPGQPLIPSLSFVSETEVRAAKFEQLRAKKRAIEVANVHATEEHEQKMQILKEQLKFYQKLNSILETNPGTLNLNVTKCVDTQL